MKETIRKFERKYEAQDELLDSWIIRDLDERTLHETIKAMLINTVNDCIKYECALDPEMESISWLVQKENKTEEDIKKLKHSQDRLKVAIHLAEIAEGSLANVLSEMLLSDEIKLAFRQDIPELYENLYFMIDIEDDIIDNLVTELSDSYDELSYKQICGVINNCIADMVDNVEEYVDDIQEKELYDEFVQFRDEWRKTKKEYANE